MVSRGPARILNIKKIAGIAFGIAGVWVLVQLGLWQVDRLQWKTDLLARLEQGSAIPVENSPALVGDIAHEFTPVRYDGRLMQAQSVLAGPRAQGGAQNGAWGYWVVTPLETDAGVLVWVNRGWADTENAKRLTAQTGEPRVAVQGILRRPGSISKYAQTSALVVFAQNVTPPDERALAPAPVIADIRNNHLQYAVFWFCMAGVLVVMMIAASLRGRRSA